MTRLIRDLAQSILGAALILFILWAIGALLGVVAIGFCSVAGCR